MPTLPVTAINEIASIVGNSRSAFAAFLKLQYAPSWDAWVHTESSQLSNRIAKKKGTMYGQMKVGLVTTKLPQSAGISTGERYRLPSPSTSAALNPRTVARDFVSRLRYTMQVRNAARAGDSAAWRRPQQEDMENARLQSGLNWGFKLWNGFADIRAVASGASTQSSATSWIVPLRSRDSRAGGSATLAQRYRAGIHYLREGMSIGLLDATDNSGSPEQPTDAANNSQANEVTITDVDDSTPSAPTMTIAPLDGTTNLTTALGITDTGDGDMIVPYASRQDSASMYAADGTRDTQFFTFNGVDCIVGNQSHVSTCYGILKTATKYLEGIFDGNSGTARVWTERYLTFMIHRIRNEGTGGSPDVAMVHDSVLREVVDENRGARWFEPVQRGSGFDKSLSHTAGDTMTPYAPDWLCPPGRATVLDTKTWGWYSESDMMPDPETRFVPDYLQSEQIWHKSGNIECKKPRNNGHIEDVQFSTTALT